MTRTSGRVILLALLLSCAASAVRAGAPRTVAPGDRVRLEYREIVHKKVLLVLPYVSRQTRHVAGELVAITSDSVTIRRDDDHVLQRRSLLELDALAVAAGKRRHVPGGLVYGFLAGLVVSDRWEKVSGWKPVLSAGTLPGGRGADVGVACRF